MKVRKSEEKTINKDNWNNIGCIFAGLQDIVSMWIYYILYRKREV